MKRTHLFWLAGALACAVATSATAREFKLGTIVPGSHAWSQAAEAMGRELDERSGGEHSVVVFPSGQLGDESQMMRQLQTGGLDMAFLTVAEMSNRVQDFGALYAPYLVKNVTEAGELLHGPSAQGMLDKLPKEAGVVGIGYGIAAMRVMLTTFPVDSATDLSGHKIRITPFEPIKDFYNILGAASTPMPLPDVYDAMANGQVDGVDADMELVWKLRFHDHADTLLRSNHMMFPMVGVVSRRVWQGLGAEERDLVRETMTKALDDLFVQYVQVEKDMFEKVSGTDVTVKEVGREFFRDAIDQWEAIWIKKTPVLKDLRREVEAMRQ